jgi:hypothetical protein
VEPAVAAFPPLAVAAPPLPALLSPELPPQAVTTPNPNKKIPNCFIDPPRFEQENLRDLRAARRFFDATAAGTRHTRTAGEATRRSRTLHLRS